jgi:hypothetical protein
MTVKTSVVLPSVALGVLAAAALVDGGQDQSVMAAAPAPLTASGTAATGALLPGGVLTGSLVLSNSGARALEVTDVVLGRASAPGCAASGVVVTPTVPPTPQSPLDVPARGTTTLEWTAFMDGEGDHACQGARLESEVSVDGENAGTVTVAAGRLERPPAPTGSGASVSWDPSPAASPAYVLERARAGTDDWQPACGSSAQRPLWAPSCTDTGLPPDTAHRYRVTVRSGHWRATSRPSEPVQTAAAGS